MRRRNHNINSHTAPAMKNWAAFLQAVLPRSDCTGQVATENMAGLHAGRQVSNTPEITSLNWHMPWLERELSGQPRTAGENQYGHYTRSPMEGLAQSLPWCSVTASALMVVQERAVLVQYYITKKKCFFFSACASWNLWGIKGTNQGCK